MFKFAELLQKVTVKDTDNWKQEEFNLMVVKSILKNLPQDRKI
jgi:hypothetical protein